MNTEIQHSSGHEAFVTTKLDFASGEEIMDFPERFGKWSAKSYNKSSIDLGAVSRTYWHEDYFKPVFFLIIHAKNTSAFHPPTVCYPALG